MAVNSEGYNLSYTPKTLDKALAKSLLAKTRLKAPKTQALTTLVNKLRNGKIAVRQITLDANGYLREGRIYCEAVLASGIPFDVCVVTDGSLVPYIEEKEEEEVSEHGTKPFKLTQSTKDVCELAAKILLKVAEPTEEYIQRIANFFGEKILKVNFCVFDAKESEMEEAEKPSDTTTSPLIRLALALKVLNKEDEDYVLDNYVRFMIHDKSMPLILRNLREHIKSVKKEMNGSLSTGKRKLAQKEEADKAIAAGKEAFFSSVDEDMLYRVMFAFSRDNANGKTPRAYPETVVKTLAKYKGILEDRLAGKLQQGIIFEEK